MGQTRRIGDILVEREWLSRAEVEELAVVRARSDTRLLSVAVKAGKLDEEKALRALSVQQGVPGISLSRAVIPRDVARRVPLEIACKDLLLPVRYVGSTLLLAMANPQDWRVIDEMEFATGLRMLPHAALYADLVALIPRVYATKQDYFVGPAAESWVATDDPDTMPLPFFVEKDAPPPPEAVSDADIVIVVEEEDVTPPMVAGSGRRVLVVEDEPEVRTLVVNTIRPLGVEVMTAERGLEGLQAIKTHAPDLIILDAMLPEVHGFEICKKVKESQRFGHTPVLMISAIYRGWRIAEDIKSNYKVDAFLEKPFRIADLRRSVEALLRAPSTRKEMPLDASAQSYLAQAAEDIEGGHYDQALGHLRKAEALSPFSGQIQLLMGHALERKGRDFQAIYHYERAVELAPGLFAASKALALLYQGKGFRNKAREMWERSLQSAPSPEVREEIKRYLVSTL